MTINTKKALHIALWALQALLSISLCWAAYIKLIWPLEQLAEMWPWVLENQKLVRITGIFDGLAGIGLVIPGLLKIKPRLTLLASGGLVFLMICAIGFHILRDEIDAISFNFVFCILAGMLTWGRIKIPLK
ncbi:DoxX family protein [Marinoscillum pacificum]|uniref:DoxX family protein n=1 Tax=Marinoscillum pacificum TaxID=392723 RepID=UPI002157B0AF|nr:DoxX family protein [Marinoscillum pacificum]